MRRVIVTVQLICAFVFTYAKSMFSHDMSHIPDCSIEDTNSCRITRLVYAISGRQAEKTQCSGNIAVCYSVNRNGICDSLVIDTMSLHQ